MLDVKIRTTSDKLRSFELCTIVCQNYSEHAKSVYNALQELDRCLLSYIYRWYINPLGVLGRIPTMLIPQTAKGQEISIGRRGLAFFIVFFWKN
jgi:hypothetical protein